MSIGFLTPEKFLAHFPLVKISRAEFVKKLIINYTKPLTLENAFSLTPIKMKHKGREINRRPIMRGKDDERYIKQEQVIDYFYQMVVTHRHYYLRKFYEAYFCFKNPFEYMKWDSKVDLCMPSDEDEKERGYAGNLSLQKNDASRRMVRNLFYLELLHLTKVTNTVKSQVSFWQGLDNLYNRFILEDRFFAPSSIGLFLRPKKTIKAPTDIPKPPRGFKGFNLRLNYHNLFYLFQGYQPKASIINPYFIHWCLENVLSCSHDDGKKLFTPVLSWASYLIAYMHSSGWDHYVGVDVMPTVCEKVNFLAEYYWDLPNTEKHEDKDVDLYCQPSELLAKDKKFLSKYKGYFDLVLICPPYYNMEIYHEGQQSIDLYPNYQDWLIKYWLATVKMCYHTCRIGGQFAMIVNNYYTLSGEFYPLVDDLTKLVKKAGFKYVKFYYLFNRASPLRVNKKDRTERLVIFRR